ncbi:MAG: RagB/SusD family nutrient uptake outer membrane protein [Ferruginibacter sp.]
MKKSKIIWSLLAVVIMLVTVTGCKKFLTKEPLTSTLDDLHQGTLEAQSFGLYNILRTTSGFSELVWLDYNSIRDDDAQKGSSATDGAEVNTEYETFQYSKDDWAPNTYWNDHYSMISAANKELYFADSLHATDAASQKNVGEAHFFRAYAFFDLVKAYGQVPLLNFYFTTASAGIKPKATVDQIYAQIDADLDSASRLLPLNWSVGGNNIYPGRLTKGAANTLWAQTYLFRQNWTRVISLCNQVILSAQYSLSPTFSGIFQDGLSGAGKNGSESIFETQNFVTANGVTDNGNHWGTCQQVRQGGAPLTWNLGWGWNVPTAKLVTAWDNTDPRKASTVLFSGQYDGGSAVGGYGATLPGYAPGSGLDQPYWNKKVYSDPQMRQFTGEILSNGQARWINHRILRYADVLLMLAEASNEMNDGPTAADNLEKIRNRASGNLGIGRTIVPTIAFVDKNQMRTAIKNERRWEFAMEGYRFYDLVRWGDAISELGALGYTDRAKYYPIPQKVIDASGGVLKQNPDWP